MRWTAESGRCEGSWSPIMFSWWHFRSGHRVRSVSFKKYVDMIMYEQDGQGQIWVILSRFFRCRTSALILQYVFEIYI